MKLASVVHPSKKWPARAGWFAQDPTDWQVIVFSVSEGWQYYYCGPSKFRMLLAVARVCEFSDGNDRWGVFFGEDHVSNEEARKAWDLAGKKCLARGAQRRARVRIENDVEEGRVMG